MAKKILIIGAGFLQAFVIRKAKELGYDTYAVDADPSAVGFAYADHHATINIVDEEACLAYARQENINGVLTAATDYGVLTAAYIAQEMHLPGLKYEVAKLIKNKYRVRKCLYEHRVDDTEQAYEVGSDTDLEALCQQITFPVMVKPCDGSGSRGASRVDTKDAFASACRFAMASSLTKCATVETFIVGKEYGAESLVVNGEVHVLGIMRKWMTEPPYYAELGHAIPTDLPHEVEQRAKQCVQQAIEALGINFGSVNMDLLITAEGKIYIIDIGARMGGNMIGPCIIPYGTGVDYVANMIRNAVGDKVDLTPIAHGAVATRLLAFDTGVVKQLPDFKALEQKYGVEIYHHLEVGQAVNEYHTNLDGCGYIVAKADTVDTAIEHAEQVLDIVRNSVFKTTF
ncbi:MAG: ATP-grasp domain-containing protein [Clostridia bacterium]|nr:ATP-grasp domain-containing protein [Clostridia bacterium]